MVLHVRPWNSNEYLAKVENDRHRNANKQVLLHEKEIHRLKSETENPKHVKMFLMMLHERFYKHHQHFHFHQNTKYLQYVNDFHIDEHQVLHLEDI